MMTLRSSSELDLFELVDVDSNKQCTAFS